MNKSEISNIYKSVDEFIQTQNNCCKKSCSFCCYQQIEVMNVENEIITNFINDKVDNQTKAIIKEDLTTWFNFFDQNTPNNKTLDAGDIFRDFRIKVASRAVKCPFLINNLCSIYEVRPFACRIHIVENSPELCFKDREREPPNKVLLKRQEIVYFMSKMAEISIMPLPFVVKNIFLPDRKLKPMYKIVL
jgi:Fe-S-cluster containining protein